MATPPEEVARRLLIDGYGGHDLETLLSCLHADVEWLPPIARAEGQAYRGHDGVRLWWADMERTFEGWEAVVEETRATGGRLLVLGRIRSRGRGSGAAIDQPVGWLFDMRDGLVARMEVVPGHGEAVRVAAAAP